MNFADLINLTRLYARDNNSYVFTDAQIKIFLNQAIDRIKQYGLFKSMPKLSESTDVPKLLPEEYHYILALFASSRCYDMDERFYEGVEKRNEFEQIFDGLIARIQGGDLTIYSDELDGEGNPIALEDPTCYMDCVKDVYFNYTRGDELGDTIH